MKLSAPQRLMHKDGAPPALFMTLDARRKAWAGRPLTTVPLFQAVPNNEDAATAAFRAQQDERRRLKSLQQISKMKVRQMTKKIDHDVMRWDPRTCRFVEDTGSKAEPTLEHSPKSELLNESSRRYNKEWGAIRKQGLSKTKPTKVVVEGEWSRVTKDTARALAELNSVWDGKYAKLSGGLLVMTVTNRLKGLVKKGGEVQWK